MLRTMTSVNVSDLRDRIGHRTPALELMQMFRDPRVVIVGIVCGTVVVLGLLGMVGWLVYAGRPVEALLLIMTSLLVPLMTTVLARVTVIGHQTNGTNSRLLDAAVGRPQQPAPAESDQP